MNEKEEEEERKKERFLPLIVDTMFSTSVCNANRWRMHFARTNKSGNRKGDAQQPPNPRKGGTDRRTKKTIQFRYGDKLSRELS